MKISSTLPRQKEYMKRFAAGIVLLAALLCVSGGCHQAHASIFSFLSGHTEEETEKVSSGWQHEGNSYYYCYSTGRKATGFLKRGGRWYHFSSSGELSLGWFTVRGNRYYASPTGSMGKSLGALKSGFVNISGKFYELNSSGRAGSFGRQTLGWVIKGAYYYYYSADGQLATGLTKIGKKVFFFRTAGPARKKGRVQTGWKTIDGNKYYFRTSGKKGVYGSAYQNTTVKIGGKSYTFDKQGILDQAGGKQSGKSKGKLTRNEKFIEKIGALAHADMQKSGVLASVTTAQAIVESNYGKSILGRRAKNLFGMKANLSGNNWPSSWGGKVYYKRTLEYVSGRYITVKAPFRRYKNWAASIADHSAYLTGAKSGSGLRYKGLAGCTNYRKACRIIKNGGYATAPNYVDSLCSIIEKYDLTRFDS